MQSSKIFSRDELMCKCNFCQANDVNHRFNEKALKSLQRIRDKFSRPIVISSAYRCDKHPVEKVKARPGTHWGGIAVDVRITNGRDRARLIQLFVEEGWRSIGWAKDFIHFDRRKNPTTWDY